MIGARTIPFSVLLLVIFLILVMQPVSAKTPFNVDFSFQSSWLVSGAPNSAVIHFQNIALVPILLVSVGINFPWMQTDSYIIPNASQADLAVNQTLVYTIPFEVPANVSTGEYYMNTLVSFQTNQSVGVEWVAYVRYIAVVGQVTPFWVGYDLSDGRLYSAMAVIILVGWFLPRKLRSKA
jgi:hypothetical protein